MAFSEARTAVFQLQQDLIDLNVDAEIEIVKLVNADVLLAEQAAGVEAYKFKLSNGSQAAAATFFVDFDGKVWGDASEGWAQTFKSNNGASKSMIWDFTDLPSKIALRLPSILELVAIRQRLLQKLSRKR